jgi:hypothetical protein
MHATHCADALCTVVCPAGHTWQDVLAAAEVDPWGHGVLVPDTHVYPAEQGTGVDASPLQVYPSVHVDAAVEVQNEEGGQVVHEVPAELAWYVPDGHCAHVDGSVAPEEVLNVPAEQALQLEDALLGAYVPPGQLWHTSAVLAPIILLLLPALQLEHEVEALPTE